MSLVKTAVFPVAGMGTRFLPITKAVPKEMLTIIDRPLIQFALEEASEAGIERVIFVTAQGKHAIEDYFDHNFELESRLEAAGRSETLALLRQLVPEHVTLCYVRQKAPKGLGDAILTAKDMVHNEPFAVLLADDLMIAPPGKPNVLTQMLAKYHDPKQAMVAVEQVEREDTDKYGIVDMDERGRVHSIVEKPAPDLAPSLSAVVGRYILPPEIFSHLSSIPLGHKGELQLTDAIASLLKEQGVTACPFDAQRFDCGSKQGYFKAVLAYAKKDPALAGLLEQATAV